MPNMSYCRFQNTLADLLDCEDALGQDQLKLSDGEKEAAAKLLKVCRRIADDYLEDDGK